MDNIKYVQMPQDDFAQIVQVGREYCTEPSKGLAHGVQKDAIQNGFGARAKSREVEACKDWSMNFELKKIRGKDSLIFWDEGTVGLTGDILSPSQIQSRIADGSLGPDQRLGRFLARLVSGHNLGPGIFGRGKLVFHAASENTHILIDSFRVTDGLYIALDRMVRNNQLVQLDKPLLGNEAREFFAYQTSGILQPLEKPGTRITIFDVNPEISETFQWSYSSSNNIYKASLAHMIEETWWEIIHKFKAKIFLRFKDNIHQISLHDPILKMVEAEDGVEGIRVHLKNNITITAGGRQYRIKELKLIVMPGSLDEELQDIWIQRKRMKIGSVARGRGIGIHHKIANRLGGYIILEPDLEDLIEEHEGLTHYGFDLRAQGIKQIRETVRSELQEFQRKLGLESTSEDAESRRRLLDSMKELNDLAAELGLVTQQGLGLKQQKVDILLKEIKLPEKGTLRVEMDDEVGPITYQLVNKTPVQKFGTFKVTARQYGRESLELYKLKQDLQPDETREIKVDAFKFNPERFENGKSLKIEAVYVQETPKDILAKCVRTLYLGTEPPVSKKTVNLTISCKFPRQDTRRIEASEVIRNIKLRATNTTAHKLTVDLVGRIRHLANPKTGRQTIPLFNIAEIKEFQLNPQEDYECYVDDIVISPQNFGSVLETRADVSERACDINGTVRLAFASVNLNKPRKWKLNTASIKFFIEVDPPGHSIFSDAQSADEPMDGRQSWYSGSLDIGYTFILNIGHSAYKYYRERGDTQIVKRYEQEQMLRQAYLIAFEHDVYKGPAEEFEDMMAGDVAPWEIARTFDTVIGTALNQIQG